MSHEHPGAVVVVGSANMDVVLSVERMPAAGETLLASGAAQHPGGKGLNQAVASARAGAPTTFIGAIGKDAFGESLAQAMESAGVANDLVRRSDEPSGQAFILVDGAGENLIVVASGANAGMTELMAPERAVVEQCAVLLMQLELPAGIVHEAAAVAKAAGRTIMLNAAPAAPVNDDLVELLDYLIVNEHEARLIAARDDLAEAAAALAARVPRLVVTLGASGSDVYDAGELVGTVAPPPVTAVDTTGAGDTYCGALAAAVAEGRPLLDAVRFATAASALSVEKKGAVSSIPSRDEVDSKLKERW
jgi:ribokinase